MTGNLSPVHASCCLSCLTMELGISAFSLLAGRFLVSFNFLSGHIGCRCVRLIFICDLYSIDGPAFTIFGGFCWLCFAVCFVLFSAWMRTAFLAGGNAVVRSGFAIFFLLHVLIVLKTSHHRTNLTWPITNNGVITDQRRRGRPHSPPPGVRSSSRQSNKETTKTQTENEPKLAIKGPKSCTQNALESVQKSHTATQENNAIMAPSSPS